MTRNFKIMGLALFCVGALGGLGAQSVSAAVNHTFTANSVTGTTALTGTTEPGDQRGTHADNGQSRV